MLTPPPPPEDQSTTKASDPTPDINVGDSWFISMDVMDHGNGYYIGNLKKT